MQICWRLARVQSATRDGFAPCERLSVAFDQRHFRPIDRNHHSSGAVFDFNWDAPYLIGLAEGIDVVELSQLIWRKFDELGVGVVVSLPVTEKGLANALVDCTDW